MTNVNRLRPHPHERLSSPAQQVDLAEAANLLRSEQHAAVSGHRQVTVLRDGPVTVVLFVFEAGGTVRQHQAPGVVTIHVLAGRLDVALPDATHGVMGGQILSLAPGVPHSIRAIDASEMLLTVYLPGV